VHGTILFTVQGIKEVRFLPTSPINQQTLTLLSIKFFSMLSAFIAFAIAHQALAQVTFVVAPSNTSMAPSLPHLPISSTNPH
jgi:hypothetical protein